MNFRGRDTFSFAAELIYTDLRSGEVVTKDRRKPRPIGSAFSLQIELQGRDSPGATCYFRSLDLRRSGSIVAGAL